MRRRFDGEDAAERRIEEHDLKNRYLRKKMYIGLGYVTNKLIEYGFNSALGFSAQIEEVRKGGRNFVLAFVVICGREGEERVLFKIVLLREAPSKIRDANAPF